MRLLKTHSHTSERLGYEARKKTRRKLIEGNADTTLRQTTVKNLPRTASVVRGARRRRRYDKASHRQKPPATASDGAGSRPSHLMIVPNTKRRPNNTKTDQLPIFEVITGLPRPYHNTLWSLTFFVFFPPDFCIFLGCLGLERSHISSEKDQKQK